MLEKPLKARPPSSKPSFEGSILTANGWMHYGPGHSPNVTEFLKPKREAKAPPPPGTLQDDDGASPDRPPTFSGGFKGKDDQGLLFSIEELRALVPKLPAVFNSLNAPDIRFFGKGLTVEAAQAMAPHFAESPPECGDGTGMGKARAQGWCGSRPDDGDGVVEVCRDQAGRPQP